jgi:hypothetical protein
MQYHSNHHANGTEGNGEKEGLYANDIGTTSSTHQEK